MNDNLPEAIEIIEIGPGSPFPMGTQQPEDGVNFSLFSRHAVGAQLELFNLSTDSVPTKVFLLDIRQNRTGDIWHIWVRGIHHGQLYGYRVEGPYQPSEGLRYNFKKLLLDPLATAISSIPDWNFGPARGFDPISASLDLTRSMVDDASNMPKCVFTDYGFDWQSDQTPNHPWSNTVIYETHVRGFTIHRNSGVNNPGTYRGLTEKIPYLKSLGVTAVELMPVQEFNKNQVIGNNPKTDQPICNYWGYDPVALIAPNASYSSGQGLGGQIQEFKEMVRAFHKADIEVILDVVFNHTAEGDELGPTLCFRGLDNIIFYTLSGNKRYYKDYTGTKNTVNANHPVVQDIIISALHYWVIEMHVDGFRFDLASALSRDNNGKLLPNAPLLERISEDPILRSVKIIAEAWDVGGAYQVGHFSGQRWTEWNDQYRDDIRRYWRGDDGMLGLFASRICGSEDIYAPSGKNPANSINFISCHDGFTLNDLVSYHSKHNEANGENNQDGSNHNFSQNNGVEGETKDIRIERSRTIQIKNFLLTLLISRGVPMLLGGDEFRRTQGGNNNAYCQDNETSWYDWDLLQQHGEIFRFTCGLTAFRRAHPILSQGDFYTPSTIQWFNPQGKEPNWLDLKEKQVACHIPEDGQHGLFLMFNSSSAAAYFNLPRIPIGSQWYLAIDTAQKVPLDLNALGEEPFYGNLHVYHLDTRSAAILLYR